MQAISYGYLEETPFIDDLKLEQKTKKKSGGGVYPLAVLTVRRCDTIRMRMTILNNTGASMTRALASLYGTYDPVRVRFDHVFAYFRDGVTIGTGTTTHDVDGHAAVAGDLFDACGAIGTITAGVFTSEHTHIKLDVLTVTGASVTGFTHSRVV